MSESAWPPVSSLPSRIVSISGEMTDAQAEEIRRHFNEEEDTMTQPPNGLIADLHQLVDSWIAQRDRMRDLNRERYDDFYTVTADMLEMCAGRLAEVVATSVARAKASS